MKPVNLPTERVHDFMKTTTVKLTLVLMALLGVKPAGADTCGKSKFLSGASCADYQFELSFEGCGSDLKPVTVKPTTCSDDSVKLQFVHEGTIYISTLSKSSDSWGAASWSSSSLMKQAQTSAEATPKVEKESKKSKKAKAQAKSKDKPSVDVAATNIKKESEPSRLTAEASGSIAKDKNVDNKTELKPQEAPLKFSGFVDFRFTNLSRDPSSSSGLPESGFGIEDAAFYVNYQKEKLSFVIDIPFRRFKNSDQNVTTNANASPNGNFAVGNDKAQAFLKYNATPELEIDLGQFDTPFGVELNDSKDRIFSKTGTLYDYFLPVTHTGIELTYTVGGFFVRAIDANSNNKGSLGASATGDNNYEYTGMVGYTDEKWRCQLGNMSRPIGNASGVGSGMRSLSDIAFGTTQGKFALDFEGSYLSDPSKNTLTPSNSNDKESDATGGLVLFTYNFSDSFNGSFRYEHYENDPGQASVTRDSDYGVSLHKKFNPSWEGRMDYVIYNYNTVAGGSSNFTDNRFSFATLFAF